ncbi:MAG: DnaJ domain-containing protein [Hoeflea sp.]|uniref:DnaJ C-terminal domain-containing protein n=1 Tax=Hoeflea sp. TaxID=1940281 RepID=UPI001D5EE627|nr:DnaJ C-terminal domain-containing protein [Hoeflea sp.]MBU4527726.1 DnaJ domain-containing protein [Alphaproteobacteria bacterium]MBU4546239.1 DnaJ domain-containing protein [Alphaproteobacteria bacterium]MBU4553076.1 DnaJ domain-containing protein [Alphaproteobacteria bacterium]MBV1724148.1 DnaJ domain-containing protein [Hoeflea sp.]MBV1759833.1 DnaJ domain-containing protein [Hoeflea sp.]
MRSPYTVLGVSKTARTEDIKSAYRQLAKTWHPDQNPGDPQAGGRFAEIAHAYKLLVDSELRMKFDSGQIDARGRRQAKPARGFTVNPFKAFKEAMGRQTMGAASGANAGDDPGDKLDEASFKDMVAHIFGEAAARQAKQNAARDAARDKQTSGRRTETNAPGMDEDPLDALDALFAKWKTRQKPQSALPATRHHVEISLESALAGTRADIIFEGGRSVAFAVPAGTVDGAEIQVPSPDPSALGDAIVTIRHQKHPHFHSSGADLHGEHGIALAEAVLGGSIVFRGLDGPLKIEVPQWSGSDTVLRVQEKGLPTAKGRRGALLVHLRVMLPEKPDPRLIDLMRSGGKELYI